jgi:hypothetical protein
MMEDFKENNINKMMIKSNKMKVDKNTNLNNILTMNKMIKGGIEEQDSEEIKHPTITIIMIIIMRTSINQEEEVIKEENHEEATEVAMEVNQEEATEVVIVEIPVEATAVVAVVATEEMVVMEGTADQETTKRRNSMVSFNKTQMNI